MPKAVRTNQEITNVANSIDSSRYAVIPEGTYFGIITELKWDTFATRAGYMMEKFTPTIELFTPERTIINRQDFTIGAVNEKGEYTGEYFDSSSSVIFGSVDVPKGRFGARNLMFTLGMLNSKGNVVFNEDAIKGVVVKVTVETRTYTYKGETRHENVVTNFNAPTRNDFAGLIDADVDYTNWVTYNMCTREATDGSPAEHVRIVFESHDALTYWYNTFFDNSTWENPVGVLQSDEVEVKTWADFAGLSLDPESADESVKAYTLKF